MNGINAMKLGFRFGKQVGAGIIEVLVLILLMAIGMLAMAKMHTILVRDGGTANNRAIAVSLAQEKIDDLRAFKWTHDGASAEGCGVGVFCFSEIVDGSDAITSANLLGLNAAFDRVWDVTDYYDCGDPTPVITNCTSSPKPYPDFKTVEVVVRWVDQNGQAQVKLETTIFAMGHGASTLGSGVGAGAGGTMPVVPYIPSTDVRVTPIEVGTESKRETLVPQSTTVGGYTSTEFTAYTYNASNQLIRQEDFKNVACHCRFDGVSTESEPSYAASYPAWDEARGIYVDRVGDKVEGKVKGCVQGGGSNCVANPDPLCTVCCRDHHDHGAASRKYDPYRSMDDYTSGNHNHYRGGIPVTSGSYMEACRLKRINGYWRVYQDWHMVDYHVLPLTDLQDTGKKTAYAAYVKEMIDQHIDESKVAGETLSTHPVMPASLVHGSSNSVPLSVGSRAELTARAVYLDYIDAAHLNKIKEKKAAGEDYLLHVPFYEIDATNVSAWVSSASANVRVGPYDGPGQANDLVPGEMHGLATSSGLVNVAGDLRRSTSGIVALTDAIDFGATTNPDSAKESGAISVCIGCSSASCTLPWGGTTTTSVTAYLTETHPTSCVSETRTCSNGILSGSYQYQSCSVVAGACATPWGAVLDDGQSVTAYSEACLTETRVCSSGTLSGSYEYASCINTCSTTVTGKANSKDDAITLNIVDGESYACTVQTTKNYACPVVTTPTNAAITVTSVGTVNTTKTLAEICGSKVVNF